MRKRDVLIETCIPLFLKNGVQGTTTKDIVEAAKVSNGTLFNNFETKEELLKETYFYIKDEMYGLALSNASGEKQMRNFLFIVWKSLVKYAMENRDRRMFYDSFKKLPYVRRCSMNREITIYSEYFGLIEDSIEKEIVNGPDMHYFFLMFDRTVEALIEYLTHYNEKYNEEFVSQKFKCYWRSVANY